MTDSMSAWIVGNEFVKSIFPDYVFVLEFFNFNRIKSYRESNTTSTSPIFP